MEPAIHRFRDLLAQLGLPNEPAANRQFLTAHAPLPNGISQPDTPFWSPDQSNSLQEAPLQDSDWAELADQLTEALRGQERHA